jgi:hypothetical protein
VQRGVVGYEEGDGHRSPTSTFGDDKIGGGTRPKAVSVLFGLTFFFPKKKVSYMPSPPSTERTWPVM